MYFPYLRGRQEEMLALREAQPQLTPLVLPVLKPIALEPRDVNRYRSIALVGGRCAVIVNSDEGRPAPTYAASTAVLDGLLEAQPNRFIPALELRPETTLDLLVDFSNRYTGQQCVVVHRRHALTAQQINSSMNFGSPAVHVYFQGGASSELPGSLPSRGNVIVRDGFDRKETNAEYPAQSYFGDLHATYQTDGYQGFGDFATVGDVRYRPGGGPAVNVALHLTDQLPDGALVVRHFVSATPPVAPDTAAKYFDALTQLVAFTGQPPSPPLNTAGVGGFLDSSAQFPGLGSPKRWSIMHHIELAHRVEQQAGATAWV